MNADDLTPAERDQVQIYLLRRWLASKQPAGRRTIRHWDVQKPQWNRWGTWGVQGVDKPLAERLAQKPQWGSRRRWVG